MKSASALKLLACSFYLCLFSVAVAYSQATLDATEALIRARPPIISPGDYESVRSKKVARAVRISEKITLDGRLEEPEWNLAEKATDFVEQQPHAGEISPDATEVRFLYDNDNLYVGVVLHDSGRPVVTSMLYDFQPGESDNINIVIDSLHDHRSGFSFTTNPVGAKRDQQLSNDGTGNLDWTGVWDVRSTMDDLGWTAEFVIPFKTLRFSNSSTQEWGLNIGRRSMRTKENSQWSPLPLRYSTFRVSLAGTLTGLEGIHQGRNLKIKPFIVATAAQTRLPTGELGTVQSLGRLTGAGRGYDGGVDLKFSLTPSVTLDGTYRTDFAHVEADQQQVNLTRFSLFFPEKRDFFLENAGTFTFGANLGYRPGQANLLPFFSRRIGLSSAGNPIPILGGSRVSGKVSQYDFGVLAMKTERSGAIPSNDFLVGRIKRNLFRNSWIGSIATSRNSNAPGDHNRVYGADAHFQFFQKLIVDSYLLQSDTPGKTGKNQARRFQTGWEDEQLLVALEYNDVQTNFDPQIGFVRRGNVGNYSEDLFWKPRFRRSDTVQYLTFQVSTDYYKGLSTQKVESRVQEASAGITFQNGGSIAFDALQTFDRLVKPFAIRPNISIAPGDYTYLQYTPSIHTNPSKKLSGIASYTWGDFWDGRQKSFSGEVALKANYHVNIDVTYGRNDVTVSNGSFTTNLVGARFTYGFTPRSFLNAFVQYNADTHQVSSNIRFNITHRPLSDIYLVYNDTRDTVSGQLVGRAFIVKFTNLFNF